MKFNYTVNPDIPQAAWYLSIEKGSDKINVELGTAIPHNDDFFVAGVWDGDFKKGRFDTAAFACCSGAIICEAPRNKWGG